MERLRAEKESEDSKSKKKRAAGAAKNQPARVGIAASRLQTGIFEPTFFFLCKYWLTYFSPQILRYLCAAFSNSTLSDTISSIFSLAVDSPGVLDELDKMMAVGGLAKLLQGSRTPRSLPAGRTKTGIWL